MANIFEESPMSLGNCALPPAYGRYLAIAPHAVRALTSYTLSVKPLPKTVVLMVLCHLVDPRCRRRVSI